VFELTWDTDSYHCLDSCTPTAGISLKLVHGGLRQKERRDHLRRRPVAVALLTLVFVSEKIRDGGKCLSLRRTLPGSHICLLLLSSYEDG